MTVTPYQQHWLAAFHRRGVPAWPLPCGCVGFRCECCGHDSATIGTPECCRYGDPGDPRHAWLVGEYAPGEARGERGETGETGEARATPAPPSPTPQRTQRTRRTRRPQRDVVAQLCAELSPVARPPAGAPVAAVGAWAPRFREAWRRRVPYLHVVDDGAETVRLTLDLFPARLWLSRAVQAQAAALLERATPRRAVGSDYLEAHGVPRSALVALVADLLALLADARELE